MSMSKIKHSHSKTHTMKSFTEKNDDIRKEAISYITEVLKKRGTNYETVDPASYEGEEITEEFYDLPRTFRIDRHDYYFEYAIVKINIDEKTNELKFVGISVFEDMDEKEFTENELVTEVLCAVADIVQNLEK